MKRIKLTGKLGKGKYTLVDDADYEWLNQWNWQFHNGYVQRSAIKFEKSKINLMHRLIMKTPKGMQTDHINMNKLDNRRENLRICTRSENRMNRTKQKNNTSGYKGVFWYKLLNKWLAQIKKDNKSIHIGYFSNKIEAAKAYNVAAKKYFGKFAKLN